MTENIPNLMKEIRPQVWEAVAIKQYIKHKEFCAKTYQNKTEKQKKKQKDYKQRENPKSSQMEKIYHLYKGGEKRLMADFSTEMLSLKCQKK